jgi:hypothetical protein
MVSRGLVRTAARRRMGTDCEVVDYSSIDIDLHDLRGMEELEARRRSCGHVVMLLSQRGARRGRRVECVRRGANSQYVCL